MNKETLDKILTELAFINYRGHIALNLYNEPLADTHICEKIKYIKQRLPNCFIQFNSNGDYLTRAFLDELEAAGLGQILITCHQPPNEMYEDKKRMRDIERLFNKLSLPLQVTSFTQGKNITCDFYYKNLRVLIVANNWSDFGNDRGGSLPALSRSGQERPCMFPFREIVIAHDGCVRMCCNIFTSENNFGNVMDVSLLDIYFSKRMVDVRRHLLCFGKKMKPCDTCTSPNLVISEKDFRTAKQRDDLLRLVLEKGEKL